MGRFKLNTSNGETLWVKKIDKVNETLEFTKNKDEAYYRDGDFYTNSELDFIKFHFKDKYPEVKDLVADGVYW
jgi:hypothetical protein